ncbi:alpha/beta fold hydrolase [Ectopseudomonas hydrolytica]|uniref:alpha/beta fold hydrolase n=1 Tax=Ectopseudomonas hydrolytica TaxID=2493633 RepID=UPI003EE0FE77
MSQNLPRRITSFQRDLLSFDVLDEGPLSGTPIVLLHGFPEFNTTWNEVGAILRKQGYRTIAPNQRGYSAGARPSGRRDYRIAELAQDIVALVDVIGAPVHLVGHDWGAGVAWAVAATRPDILRSLTTVSVPHPGAFIRSLPRGQILRSWYMLLINLPLIPEWALSKYRVARWLMINGGMSDDMFKRFWRDFGVGDAAALKGALAWYRAMVYPDPELPRKRINVPTTHVWSDRDPALTRIGAELTADYVDADYKLEIFNGVGHFVQHERPEALAGVILARVGSSSER